MFSLETLLVPLLALQIIAFGFGIIVGSFLNVYIYRFHTGKSLAGRSHCLSCGTPLRWYELVPLFSYLFLRGRCRTCGCKVPARYFLVELITGLLFVCSLTLTLDVISLLLLWFIMSLLVVITVYDLYHFIIPDKLTFVLTILVTILIGYEYWAGSGNYARLGWDVVVALGGSLFFLFLWVVSKGKWLGFGDVKLAFPLGFLVGAESVFSFVVLSFWIGAAISLLLLAWQRFGRGQSALHLSSRSLTMKSAVPFAPFLTLSAVIVLFTHFNVLSLFSF